MPTNTSILKSWLFLVALLGTHPAYAQNPPLDSLNGRIVHVYLPSDEVDVLMPVNNMGDVPMKKNGYWYTATLRGGPYDHNDGFFFTTTGRRMNLSMSGFQTTEGRRILKSQFEGKKEMWIIMDPAMPLNTPPRILLEPPKIVNILNPWETTAPRLVLPGGRKKNMVTVPGRCGWFMAFLLETTDTKLHFEEVNNTATYGGTGLTTPPTDYNIADEFTSKGIADSLAVNLWLDTDINTWLPVYPNKDGTCQYMLAGIVRDFSAAHPDFQFGVTGDHSVSGVVQPTIGPEPGRKPIVNPAAITRDPAISFSQFDKWWITDSTNPTPALRSYESCYDIPMSKTGDGSWEYDSFKDSPDHSFFPVEENNRNPAEEVDVCYFKNTGDPPEFGDRLAGQKRNGNFCMESHATFIYQPGQTFSFRGDDDVWVFINNKLVVDLGGVHIPKSANVRLDSLNLTNGQTYKWDLFYCDREACGSSLRIKTSIFFKQQKALEAVPDPTKPGTYKIVKREGGKGSCAGQSDVLTEVPAVNLIYQLWDATGKIVDTTLLANLPKYNGSIAITPASATPRVDAVVKVDTNIVVTNLAPGNYRIVAIDAVNQKVKAEMPYKVPARNQVMVHAPVGDTTVPLGTLVRVIFANKFNNAVVPAVQSYAPSFPPDLIVYLDAAKTQRATPASFTTDATGYDTLWVTDTTLSATDKQDMLTVPGTLPTLKITFIVPKNKVELEPPTNAGNHLTGTLVRVVAANREAGALVPKADNYTLTIPAGLDVYSDSGKTKVAPGTVLTTSATGFDSLWVTSNVAKDTTYVLGITGSGKTVTIGFLTPKDRMQFDAPLARDTLVGSLVRLTASNREGGVLVPKAQGYTLDIPDGLEVYTDAAKTAKLADGAKLTSAPDGLDTLWVTADSVATNYEDKPYTLVISDGLNPVTITFRMPPLVIPKALTAAIFDEDGDGIADRLAVTYDRDISGNLPQLAEYRWPAATTPPQAITDLAAKVAGTTLTHRGPMTGTPATGGDGIYVSTYKARNKTYPQAIAIHDRMGPILIKAEIVLGTTSDTLRLKFSEPINTAAITGATGSLFSYKVLPDADPVSFEPASIAWDADRQGVSLVFPNPSTAAPRSGNLVRINDGDGLIADANGNKAGPASRFRLITGTKRTEIQTVTYRQIEQTPTLLSEDAVSPSLQPLGSEVKVVVEKTGRMGHLIKTDLGDYAVGDDFVPVQPSQVTLEYHVSYFTNHGTPILSAKRAVACTDQAVFGGDCLKNRGFIFVGWNYTSQDGRKIGTGAIVARIRYQVKVAGKVRESEGLDQVWGVLRR